MLLFPMFSGCWSDQTQRHFEVMPPVQFNDGGHWRHSGVAYRDDLVKLIVDMPDSAKNRTWMKDFKSRWKDRLEQIELEMVSHPIEVEKDWTPRGDSWPPRNQISGFNIRIAGIYAIPRVGRNGPRSSFPHRFQPLAQGAYQGL